MLSQISRPYDSLAVFLFLGQPKVEGQEFFELVVNGAKAVGLQVKGIKLFTKL